MIENQLLLIKSEFIQFVMRIVMIIDMQRTCIFCYWRVQGKVRGEEREARCPHQVHQRDLTLQKSLTLQESQTTMTSTSTLTYLKELKEWTCMTQRHHQMRSIWREGRLLGWYLVRPGRRGQALLCPTLASHNRERPRETAVSPQELSWSTLLMYEYHRVAANCPDFIRTVQIFSLCPDYSDFLCESSE